DLAAGLTRHAGDGAHEISVRSVEAHADVLALECLEPLPNRSSEHAGTVRMEPTLGHLRGDRDRPSNPRPRNSERDLLHVVLRRPSHSSHGNTMRRLLNHVKIYEHLAHCRDSSTR